MSFSLPHNLQQEYIAGQKYAKVQFVQENFDACISASNTLDHSLSNTNAALSNTNAALSNTNAALSNTNAALSNTNAKVDTLAQSSVYLGKIELSAIPASMLPLNGWYAMNGDRYPANSPVGQRLLEIAELDYMQEFLSNCPIRTKTLLGMPTVITPAMTSNTAPGPYEVFFSAEHPTYKGYRAFNKSFAADDAWLGFSDTPTTQENEWIGFSFGITLNRALMQYQLRTRNSSTDVYLTIGWEVYVGASPDKNVNDWVLVDTRTNDFTAGSQLHTYTVQKPVIGPTGKVKFNFLATSEGAAMGEIYLLMQGWNAAPAQEINIPNWSANILDYVGFGGTSPGGIVMPFMRPVAGTRTVGSVERDAVRNIEGSFTTYHGRAAYAPTDGSAKAFKDNRRFAAANRAQSAADPNTLRGIDMDVSLVIPTGPENTVTNRGMTPVIYLGV